MDMITAPIRELGEYDEIEKALKKQEGVALTGCVESQKLHMLYGVSDTFPIKIIATYSGVRAKELYEDSLLYDHQVFHYPAKDLIFYQADVHGNELVKERMKCLRRILEGKPITLITTFESLMTPQVPPEILRESIITIDGTTPISEETLSSRLVMMGYEKCDQVEVPGQFSVRGGIVDILI